MGRTPAFFIARGNDAGDILTFALVFALGPILAVWLIEEVLERIVPRVRWAFHLCLLALAVACLALQVIGQFIQRPAGLMILAALVIGTGSTRFYVRGRFLRATLDLLSPAPLIVLLFFLVISPASKLVLPGSQPKAAEIEIANPVPVVMVIFDEFPLGSLMTPAGEIDASRYPNFAELAQSGTWYRNATSTGAFTTLAVPAILTGRVPGENELPISWDQPESIFTLLGGTYEMHVREDATQICPTTLCPEETHGRSIEGDLGLLFEDLWIVSQHLLYPQALRKGLPDVSQAFGGFARDVDGREPSGIAAGGNAHVVAMALARAVSDEETIRVRDFTEYIAEQEPPTLHLIHVEKPHYPWKHLPDGRLYSPNVSEWIKFADQDSVWEAPETVTDIALQRHLLEVGYVDWLLGQVIGRMKESGIWRDALMVVAADHGAGTTSGVPRRTPDPGNFGEVASVPVFIKAPGQDEGGEIVDDRYCITDVLPEVAAHLGIEYPWQGYECPPDEIVIGDLPSGTQSAPVSTMLEQRQRYVERIERLFGTGRGWDAVIKPRETRALLGRRLPVAPAKPGQSATPVDQVTSFLPDSASALALLQRGTLSGVGPGERIAITANGRLAGVGKSFEAVEGGSIYSVLISPDYLKKGSNEIGVHRLVGEGDAVRLQPLVP